MKKRGQVTVFIVIGLILLISLSLFFYFKKAKIKLPEEKVPTEFLPVATFIKSCLETTAKEALIIAGRQAGYIEIPQYIKDDPYKRIQLFSNMPVYTPLWYFDSQEQIPTLEFIKTEIENYIKRNLESCLNNFTALANKYEIKNISSPEVNIIIADSDVKVNLIYPIKARITTTRVAREMKYFNIDIDVKLKKLYELAKQIMQYEDRTTFFERFTLNIISLNPEIPLAGIEFSCSRKTWSINNVKKELQETIRQYLRMLRLEDVDYLPFLEDISKYEKIPNFPAEELEKYVNKLPELIKKAPSDIYEYKHLFLDVSPSSYKEFRAYFSYNKEWPLLLAVKPSRGGRLYSNTGKGISKYLSYVCINFYKFTYDVYYPILVTLYQPDAFEGMGYAFRFAFPVMLDNNAPARRTFNFASIEALSTEEDVCNARGAREYIISATSLYGRYLKDVNITYLCYNIFCDLGKTSYVNGIYALKTTLPEGCTPIAIRASKEGYIPEERDITAEELSSGRINLVLTPLAYAPFDIKLYDSETLKQGNKNKWILLSNYMQENENKNITATIYLKSYNKTYETTVVYPEEKIIKLIADNSKYKADISISEEGLIIAAFTGNLTIDASKLFSASKIILPAIKKTLKPIMPEHETKFITEIYNGTYNMSLLNIEYK